MPRVADGRPVAPDPAAADRGLACAAACRRADAAAAGRRPARPGGARAAGGRCGAAAGAGCCEPAAGGGADPRRPSVRAGSGVTDLRRRRGAARSAARLEAVRSARCADRGRRSPDLVTGRPPAAGRVGSACAPGRRCCGVGLGLGLRAALASACAAAAAAASAAPALPPLIGRGLGLRPAAAAACGCRLRAAASAAACGGLAAPVLLRQRPARRRHRPRLQRRPLRPRPRRPGRPGGGGTGPGTADGSPTTDPVPAPSTISIAESPAGTMPERRGLVGDLRGGVQQGDVPLQRLDRQPQIGGLALRRRRPHAGLVGDRVQVQHAGDTAGEQRDQHHDERRPVQRGRDRLARPDQPGGGHLLLAPLAALVRAPRGGGGRAVDGRPSVAAPAGRRRRVGRRCPRSPCSS